MRAFFHLILWLTVRLVPSSFKTHVHFEQQFSWIVFLRERTETMNVLQTSSQNDPDEGDSYVETGQHCISELHSYDRIT